MECVGVRIAVKKIEMSISRLREDARELKKLIFQEAGCEFELDSRARTSDALRKVGALREWITSRSLTQSGMEQLAWRHRLIEQIVRYRRVCERLRELDAIRNAARRHCRDCSRLPRTKFCAWTLPVVRDQISGAPGSHCSKVWTMRMHCFQLLLAFRMQRYAVVSFSVLRRR